MIAVVALRERMVPRLLALCGVLLVMASCSGSSVLTDARQALHHGATSATNDNHCAQLFVRAMTTPAPVAGAFACLSPSLQAAYVAAGLTSDADLATFAATDPVYDHFVSCRSVQPGFLDFDLTNSTNPGVHRGLSIATDSAGRVDHTRFSRSTAPGSTCP